MKFAIFDLDGTLMPSDAAEIWMWYVMWCEKLDPKPVEAIAQRFVEQYLNGTLDIQELETYRIGFLTRFKRANLDRYLAQYLAKFVKPFMTERAVELVRKHTQAGDDTVICSATYSYLSLAVGKLFGIRGAISTVAEEGPDGEFTGRVTGDISFQEGKVRMVSAYLKAQQDKGVHYDEVVFYSDSINDKPLFLYVESIGGRCVVVNGDEKLSALAREHGWETCRTFEPEAYVQLRNYWKNYTGD